MLRVELLGRPVPEVGCFRLAAEAQLLGLYEVVLWNTSTSRILVIHETGHALGLDVLVLHLVTGSVCEVLVLVLQFA